MRPRHNDFVGHVSAVCDKMVIAATALLIGVASSGCARNAEQRLEMEQRRHTARARLKYELARQQFENGESAVAIATVGEAIAANATSSDQYLLLAQCHIELGEFVSARAAAEQALLCDPDEAEADYTLGVVAERLEQLDVALMHYRRARSRGNNAVDFVVAEAECLASLGSTAEAIELVSTNIGRLDSDGTLELLLAHLSVSVKDTETALRSFGLAAQRSGCDSEKTDPSYGCKTLIEEYGRLLSSAGRHSEAIAVLQPYANRATTVPASAAAALCASFMATGKHAQASNLMQNQTSQHPDSVSSWMQLARASILQEDWETASRCVDQLNRLAPTSDQTRLIKAFVAWKRGDLEIAAVSLEQELRTNPNDPLGHCLLGHVLEATDGGSQAAEIHYDRVRQIDPQFACARQLP